MCPLRLCPNASIPSDVVSRCTQPGQGLRTSRTANTMSRGNGVQGHTRSGADDGPRPAPLRGAGRDTVTAQFCEARHRPVPRLASRQFVKERPPLPIGIGAAIDGSIAGLRRCADLGLKSENKKGPDPCQIRASAYRDSRARSYALPSPGCTWSSFRSSQEWLAGRHRCSARVMRPPNDFIAAARTHATQPFMGRLPVTMCADFTMKPLKKYCSMSEGGEL